MSETWGEWRSGNVKATLLGKTLNTWSLFTNDLFIVTLVPFVCDLGRCYHLVMRSKPDGANAMVALTWARKQRIKSALAGPEALAVEVFPPESELVDQADAYHLWVLPAGTKLPFGVTEEGST
jgi:hypothetical protein